MPLGGNICPPASIRWGCGGGYCMDRIAFEREKIDILLAFSIVLKAHFFLLDPWVAEERQRGLDLASSGLGDQVGKTAED